ncbi:DUF3772 domain-containing protein [Paracoccus jiaweipingae]|uniref:DUF3772 domain-containing protein n=1 Tax=unclassified Paracoccus (in: a-proteobacteria) TaxID=2688777 RepID=UPI00378A344C
MIAVLAMVLSLALSVPAMAQDDPQVDYARWEKLAGQVETVLEGGSAPDGRLETMRADVVKWRDKFQSAKGTNAPRIATLNDQIKALGPAPKEGEAEAEDIAARRKELNEQLSKAQAPRLAAVEAFSRADAIVQQIDKQLRDRQAMALMRLSPSPLNPVNWPSAWQAARDIGKGLVDEQTQRAGRKGWDDALKSNGPAIGGLLLGALLLLTVGRRWVDTLPGRLSKRASDSSRAAVDFLVSLIQIVLPMAGVVLGVIALSLTGLFGQWGEPLLFALPVAAVTIFLGRWLISRVFPRHDDGDLPLPLPTPRRIEARYHAFILTLLLALYDFLTNSILPVAGLRLVPEDDLIPYRVADMASAVIFFPLICVAALVLFRLGQILRRTSRHVDSESVSYRVRLVSFVGGFAVLSALVAPVLAAIGYVSAANAILWPVIMSLGLIGILIVLQDFIADLYVMLRRGKEGAREALAPVLIGFALVLLSLPVFALIWGARPADIQEFWAQFQQGVVLGGIRLSPGKVLTFIIVFFLGLTVTRLVQGAFRSSILPKTRLDDGAQNAAISGLGYLGMFLAAMLAITSAGIDLSSLAIVAGALSVGIGFGMQNIVSNFVSGIILLIERPVTVGDWIDAGGRQGIVKRIAVRSTRIQTFDKTEVIVPNSDLITQAVTNWTRGSLTGRIIVQVSVAYGSDTRQVADILMRVAEDQPTVLINPAPTVLFTGFGADGLDFEVRCIVSDINGGLGVQSEIRHQIYAQLNDAGIEIPFAQRDLRLRNPEVLTEALRNAGLLPKAVEEREAQKAPDATAAGQPSPHQRQPVRGSGNPADNASESDLPDAPDAGGDGGDGR